MKLVDCILSEDYDSAEREINTYLAHTVASILESAKDEIAASLFLERKYPQTVRRVGRLNLVRIRVRRGKVQRRKKVSAVKGWTFRQNKLTRMRPSERLRRRLGARRAKIRRRSKKAQIRRRTLYAMRKRRALGLSYRPFGR